MNVVKYQNINTQVGFNAEKILAIKEFICDEFIHGGHLAALSVTAIALSTVMLFNIVITWEFLIVVYLLTLCIYGYDHYKELYKIDASNNLCRTNHLKKYYKYFPMMLTIYGTGFLVVLYYFGNVESFIFGGLLLLAGLLYTNKFKKLTGKMIGFKNYYTSFSISSLVIFTAIYYCTQVMNWVLFLIFILLFLRLMINTSFCDIKDMNADKKDNLLTLPIVLGKKRFITFLHLINLISIIPIIIGVYMKLLPQFSLFLLASTFYSSYYLFKTKNKTINILSISSTLVDGEFILWPFLLFLGKSVMTII